jgi:Flp pilus assembly protein TadD
MEARLPAPLRYALRRVDLSGVRTCGECGVTVELDYGFNSVKSLSGRLVYQCASCTARGRERRERLLVAFPFVLLVLLFALGGDWRTALPTVAILPILWVVVGVHELGHAIVSRALGLRVYEVVFGSGRRLVRAQVGGVDVEFRVMPFGGHTMAAPVTRTRVRMILSVLAGPLANLALALFLLKVWPRSGPAVPPLVLANLVILFGNLLPVRAATPAGPMPSDGLAIYTLLRAPDAELDEADAIRHAAESVHAMRRGDHAAAVRWGRTGLHAHPGNRRLRNVLGAALIRAGDFDAARALLLAMLADDDGGGGAGEPHLRAMDLNNLAWADLMSGDPARLGEALECSAIAYRQLGWNPAVAGTRGYALIEQGELDDGLALAARAYEAHDEADNRALTACTIAIGAARRGDRTAATRMLDRAVRHDAACPLLERARNEVDQVTPVAG